MDDLSEFTIALAIRTGDYLQKFFNQAGTRALQKPDHTVVTEADLAADQLITNEIHKNFPEHEIISEESSYNINNPNNVVWIIDPLDGTTNFSLGLPIWGVSIACLLNGYPEIGAAYFPIIKELYSARHGYGAFLNHEQMTSKAPDPTQPMSFFACCSRSYRQFDISIPYKHRIMGSGVYNFCMVARGSALLGLDAAPKIWDLAAAWLLVEEAGGVISPFEGPSPFPIHHNIDYSSTNYPTLAGATPDIFTFGQQKICRKS
jgi:myo-inositol-1(or 4)-monophosphatase